MQKTKIDWANINVFQSLSEGELQELCRKAVWESSRSKGAIRDGRASYHRFLTRLKDKEGFYGLFPESVREALADPSGRLVR